VRRNRYWSGSGQTAFALNLNRYEQIFRLQPLAPEISATGPGKAGRAGEVRASLFPSLPSFHGAVLGTLQDDDDLVSPLLTYTFYTPKLRITNTVIGWFPVSSSQGWNKGVSASMLLN
jgi:hypothetical protein